MSGSTRATRQLEQAGVAFTVHQHDYDPGADRVGLQAAEALGGISPFGQMKRVPVALEAAALDQDLLYLNGGQCGLQVRMAPPHIARLLDAVVAPVVA